MKKKVCAAVLAVSLVGQMLPAPAAFAAERANAQGRLEVAMHAELPSQGKTFRNMRNIFCMYGMVKIME